MYLQANIGGYTGQVATVIAYLDIGNSELSIDIVGKMNPSRFCDDEGNEAGLITNQPLDDCDYIFSEEDFSEAFKAYRYYANSGRLLFDEKAKRATPPLEVDKITESGSSFIVYGGITNEQLAVIALCLFARKVTDAQIALEQYDNEMEADYTMDFISI